MQWCSHLSISRLSYWPTSPGPGLDDSALALDIAFPRYLWSADAVQKIEMAIWMCKEWLAMTLHDSMILHDPVSSIFSACFCLYSFVPTSLKLQTWPDIVHPYASMFHAWNMFRFAWGSKTCGCYLQKKGLHCGSEPPLLFKTPKVTPLFFSFLTCFSSLLSH